MVACNIACFREVAGNGTGGVGICLSRATCTVGSTIGWGGVGTSASLGATKSASGVFGTPGTPPPVYRLERSQGNGIGGFEDIAKLANGSDQGASIKSKGKGARRERFEREGSYSACALLATTIRWGCIGEGGFATSDDGAGKRIGEKTTLRD